MLLRLLKIGGTYLYHELLAIVIISWSYKKTKKHIHMRTWRQHLRITMTSTPVLKVHVTPPSIICVSQKNTPASFSSTVSRYNTSLTSRDGLYWSETFFLFCKKAHLFLLWFQCLDCEVVTTILYGPHLVPSDIRVVTTAEAWAGDVTTGNHNQDFNAFITPKASHFLHLQTEEQLVATG